MTILRQVHAAYVAPKWHCHILREDPKTHEVYSEHREFDTYRQLVTFLQGVTP